MDPGKIEVRNVGINIVFIPVTKPNIERDQYWLAIYRFTIPIIAANIVSPSVILKSCIHPYCLMY